MTDKCVPDNESEPPDFRRDLERLINRYSRENGSDTPDFIIAQYLCDCLEAWEAGVKSREGWYGRAKKEAKEP